MKPAYREMVRFKEHIDCATRHFMRIVVPLEGAKKIFQRLIGHQPPRLFSERYAIEFLVALGATRRIPPSLHRSPPVLSLFWVGSPCSARVFSCSDRRIALRSTTTRSNTMRASYRITFMSD